MANPIALAVVVGTARQGAVSARVARALAATIRKREGVSPVLVSVADFLKAPRTVPDWQEDDGEAHPAQWCTQAAQANAFLFILPEYNHGYPGEWKLLIDSCSDAAYARKPAAVCGVSAGVFGGRALADHVKPVLVELKMVPTRNNIFLGKAHELVDEEGHWRIEEEAVEQLVEPTLNELLALASALRDVRERLRQE